MTPVMINELDEPVFYSTAIMLSSKYPDYDDKKQGKGLKQARLCRHRLLAFQVTRDSVTKITTRADINSVPLPTPALMLGGPASKTISLC